MVTLAQIYDWFMTGKKPTQAQFWASWGSFWNKLEQIPISAIAGLTAVLNAKAEKSQFDAHKTDETAHAAILVEPNARITALEAKTDSENNFKTITGYSLNPATRILTMNAGWEGVINGDDYTNVAAQELVPAIPLTAAGYSRIDLIVFGTDSLFVRVQGEPSTTTPIAPPLPPNTIEATFLTVGDGVVNAPVIPKPKAPVTSVQGMRGDVILKVINDLVTGGITDFLSAEQGKVLKTQINAINTLLTSDNVNLDNVQELVDAIETIQTSLSTILVNDLTTGGTTKALTAEMGKTLKGLIDALTTAKQAVLVSGTNIKTVNGVTLLGSGNVNTPDMDTTTAQSVSGLKTFLNNMFGLRNVANTFTSFFTNANNAVRTYTLQDRNGTLADLTDIASVNTNKMNVPTGGIANYLPKFLTPTTQGLSRLWDTGTFLGIGTVNTPTKDLTFGNQANREIGVEQSSNTVAGCDLKIVAGRTINYTSSDFTSLNIANRDIESFATYGTDMYALDASGNLLKQTNSVGDFIPVGSAVGNSPWRFVIDSAFNFYYGNWGSGELNKKIGTSGSSTLINSFPARINALALNGNDLYVFTTSETFVQTNLTGTFVPLGQALPNGNYNTACASPTGNVYCASGGTLWKRTGSSGLFINTYISASSVYVTPNNNVYITYNNQIYMQTNETGAFDSLAQVSRNYDVLGGNALGNVYTNVPNSATYVQQNYAVGAPNLDGGTLKQAAGTGKGTGKSRWEVYTGQKTASGTDMQVETLREYIDENGYHVYTSMPVYADNAAALAANLPVGCEYRTATGVKMIVY